MAETFYNRDKMWFGTSDYMQWIDTPNTGADVSSLGFSADSVLANGGGYVRNSWDSHKTYQFSWGESASLALAHAINAYRNGSWGRGLIYFHDPMTYGTNILPKRWADPSMAANYEAEPLVPDVFPTTTPAAPGQMALPVTSAIYPLTTGYSSQANNSEHFIPIPPGMTLMLGAVYTGGGKLYVRVDGGAPVDIPTLDAATITAGSAVNLKVNGSRAYLGIRNTTGASTSISIQAITARLADSARLPDYMGQPTTNLLANPSFETASGPVDVVTNLLTNPDFEAAGAAVVVRTNYCRNPNFETDASQWVATAAGSALSRTTSTVYRGTGSLQVVTDGSASAQGAYFNPYTTTLAAGTLFSVSAMVMMPAGQLFDISAYSIGTGLVNKIGTYTGTGAWQYVKAEGATLGASVNPYVIIRTQTAAAITFYVDDVLIEATPTVGAHLDGSTQPILRTNLHPNPAPASSAGYLAINGATAAYNSGSILVTCSPGVADSGVRVHTIPVQPGTPLTISAEIEAVNAGTWRINVQLAGQPVQQVTLPAFAAGEIRRVSFTYNPAATGTAAVYVLRSDTAGSETARIRKVQLEAVSVATPYFDGGSSNPGFAYAWTGGANITPSIEWDADLSTRWQSTANASISELTGLPPSGINTANIAGRAVVIQSARGVKSGSKGARIMLLPGANGDEYIQLDLSAPARVAGTAVAHRYQEGPITLSGVGVTRGLRAIVFTPETPSQSPVNAAGWQEMRVSYPALTANYQLRLYHGGLYGQGDVWWDLAAVVADPAYSGPSFSGATTPSPDPDMTYAWTGPANASTSALRGVGTASYSGSGGTAVIQSSIGVRDGVKSIRIIPTTTSDSGAQVTVTGLAVGQTYTILGYVTLTAPITPTSGLALGFWVGGATTPSISYTSSATNAPGTYEVRGTFTAGATSHNIRFYNGSGNRTDSVYWDTVGLFAGIYSGPWGSGVFTTPINIEEALGPWYSGEGHSGVRFVGTPTLINYNGVSGGQMGLSCNLKEVGAWA